MNAGIGDWEEEMLKTLTITSKPLELTRSSRTDMSIASLLNPITPSPSQSHHTLVLAQLAEDVLADFDSPTPAPTNPAAETKGDRFETLRLKRKRDDGNTDIDEMPTGDTFLANGPPEIRPLEEKYPLHEREFENRDSRHDRDVVWTKIAEYHKRLDGSAAEEEEKRRAVEVENRSKRRKLDFEELEATTSSARGYVTI